MVAYYPFNGNANDESGNTNDGVVQGAELSADRFGINNSAYKFDGNDWIETKQQRMLDGASESTITAWVRVSSNFGADGWGGHLVSAADHRGGYDPIHIRFTRNSTSQVNFQDTKIGNSPSVQIGQKNGPHAIGDLSNGWHQITIILAKDVSKSSFSIFVDGVNRLRLEGSDDGVSNFQKISYDRDMRFLIGALEGRPFYSQPGQFWNGNIDDVRVYNRALTAAEVTQLYSQESGEPNTVLVQGGTLPVGSALAGQTVSAFQIARFETTWAEWKEVRTWAAANGYDIGAVGVGSADSHPVRDVSWYDVLKWCNAKSQVDGLIPVYSLNGTTYKAGQSVPVFNEWANGYRLPSEAEWEWAAQGGVSSNGYTYSGSNNVEEVAWYDGNSLNSPVLLENGRGSWPVGMKKANELGLHDMSGNVFEWCSTKDSINNYYNKGGGWHYYGAPACRVFDRSIARTPLTFNTYTGFRYVRNSIGDMVTVQGGTLPSGSTLAGQQVQTFEIGRTEVTWGEWKEVRAWALLNGYSDLANVGQGSVDTHPVRNISWYDAVKWSNAKSQKEGLTPVYTLNGTVYKTGDTTFPTMSTTANGYRLPTETEWEWAARGGVSSKGYIFSGSNDLNAVAWFNGNSGGGPQSVGQKQPNELGIYDMTGNIYEWSWNANGIFRGLEGGSYGEASTDVLCRVAYRGQDQVPALRSLNLGLRLAKNQTSSPFSIKISGFTPTKGSSQTSVKISGQGLNNVNKILVTATGSGSSVEITQFSSKLNDQIEFLCPLGTTSTWSIAVFTNDGMRLFVPAISSSVGGGGGNYSYLQNGENVSTSFGGSNIIILDSSSNCSISSMGGSNTFFVKAGARLSLGSGGGGNKVYYEPGAIISASSGTQSILVNSLSYDR